jgi:putative ABC transport system ATP-binding protein
MVWNWLAHAARGSSKHRAKQHQIGKDHLIELRQVTKTYETPAGTFIALDGIDLRVGGGEFVAVVGKSGSGKSTLINMITGIDRPSSGEILMGDAAVHSLSEGQLALWRGRNLGIVFQFFQLLPTLSLQENVALPMDFAGMYPRRERAERAMHLLDQVGMADHAHKLPSAVSGGQQQRAAIARALANDPPVIIADEPTGNLDSTTAAIVFSLFEELVSKDKTILMATHDRDLARHVSRTLIMSDGRLTEECSAALIPAVPQPASMHRAGAPGALCEKVCLA